MKKYLKGRSAFWLNWKKRWIDAFEGGDAQVFSPTMLEVQTAPPAPLARSIAWSVSVALCMFVIWSLWADFDVTVSSVGSAIPSAKTKVVQALEVGRVTVIHVKDGDHDLPPFAIPLISWKSGLRLI